MYYFCGMEKFKINDIVLELNTKTNVEILDYEKFDDLVLYYTSDEKAYPEDKLELVNTPINENVKNNEVMTMDEFLNLPIWRSDDSYF
jgi:hypothetical protein